jgi:hypothetical protein
MKTLLTIKILVREIPFQLFKSKQKLIFPGRFNFLIQPVDLSLMLDEFIEKYISPEIEAYAQSENSRVEKESEAYDRKVPIKEGKMLSAGEREISAGRIASNSIRTGEIGSFDPDELSPKAKIAWELLSKRIIAMDAYDKASKWAWINKFPLLRGWYVKARLKYILSVEKHKVPGRETK